jgi:hypothetical protein
MLNMRNFLLVFVIGVLISSSASSQPNQKASQIKGLKFLSEYVIPYNTQFEKTTVGGLSGIDYFPEKKEYYLISDDRSDKNPVRFYTARIMIKKEKIDTVIFMKTTFLKNKVGNFYPNSKEDPYHTPDPEALRYNPQKRHFIWSSEGERIVNDKRIVLENPSVTEVNAGGNYLDTFQIPPILHMQASESGPRQNGVFEGLTFADNYKNLYVSVEEPLYNDGARAGTGDSSGIIRIIKFDMATKKPRAQYAYQIEPVAYPPFPPGSFKLNGISDILWLGNNQLLVVERSYSTGRISCTIKLFLADISHAQNVDGISSLKSRPEIKLVSKKLLLNMDDLKMGIDNIEGVTFGPTLADGSRSLLFVSDYNFNRFAKTQFLLFKVEP